MPDLRHLLLPDGLALAVAPQGFARVRGRYLLVGGGARVNAAPEVKGCSGEGEHVGRSHGFSCVM